MSISLDYATSLGASYDKEGNLHWPSIAEIRNLKCLCQCHGVIPEKVNCRHCWSVGEWNETENALAR